MVWSNTTNARYKVSKEVPSLDSNRHTTKRWLSDKVELGYQEGTGGKKNNYERGGREKMLSEPQRVGRIDPPGKRQKQKNEELRKLVSS